MTTQNQNWSETTIKSWARHWSWLLMIGTLVGAILWISRGVDNAMTAEVGILVPFFIAIMAIVHCLSREVLNLRKRVEDLEKKNNS